MKYLFLCAALMLSVSVYGQAARKTPVAFSCLCTDSTGALYATAFRDILASSPRFKEISSEPDKEAFKKYGELPWHIYAVSIDPSTNSGGDHAAISIVITVGDSIYTRNLIQYCGYAQVQVCAAQTLSSLDEQIASMIGK